MKENVISCCFIADTRGAKPVERSAGFCRAEILMTPKQEDETAAVEGFFRTLRIPIHTLEPSDKPDVVVSTKHARNNQPKKVGVEVRWHFNDATLEQKGSPGQKLWKFWEKLQKAIERIKSSKPELTDIHAFLIFKIEQLQRESLNSLIKPLASEIVSFVLNASETASSKIIVIPDWQERVFRQFPRYRLMQQYVKKVFVRKGLNALWDANINGSGVGVNIKQLAKVIRDKNQKAEKYNRDELHELWLLIAAPHDNVFNAMHNFPDQIDFDAQEILDACSSTPFDKIFFWSSPPHEWHRQIWPKDCKAHS